MIEMNMMLAAMVRLSSMQQKRYRYDALGEVGGEGPIHFVIEVDEQFFLAWEDNDTRTMIVNPITRFGLAELDELGATELWTVLHVPKTLTDGIHFREIDGPALSEAYGRMLGQTATPPFSSSNK